MSETRKGLAAMVLACCIWGLSALYYKQLDHIPALVVLCHRTLWSLVFFALVLALRRRLGAIAALLADPVRLGKTALAAVMISINWFLFIYSIQIGHALEASLGYYIFPLLAVALGFLVLGERMRPLKWAAVALAALAVIVLTLGLGGAPWVSLILAGTFAIYGLIKVGLRVDPVVSVTTEVLILAPLALIWLVGAQVWGWGGAPDQHAHVFGQGAADLLLLVGSGVLTGGPLILYSYASARITFATVGLVQYVNPTLQFLVASLAFGEAVTRWHAIAFPLIWVALALYSWDSLRQDRSARRAAIRAGTSGTL